ncbi:MAG: pyridoxal phosphate-dependent aminotransferase [Alphaproteobacteria bacterium]|nr:pyridoxal phosphate-dependent aminotransferase [Alphaproteobacteria bacterium]
MQLANRLSKIKPSPTVAVTMRAAELRASGVDVIGLGAGEPDFATPDVILDTAHQALNDGKTKYAPPAGIIELRQAIINKFQRENQLTFDISNITVGSGVKQLLYNAFLVTLNQGDEVIVPAPYWVSYVDQVALCDGAPVVVSCERSEGFKLTPEKLRAAITTKTKWLVLNSPCNPTGAVYSREELTALAVVLRDFPQIQILSDDIYEHIRFTDAPFVTFANVAPDLKDRILTMNGVSKTYVMTGFRLGYAAGNKTLIKAMNMINSQTTTSACTISQWAAVAALAEDYDFLQQHRKIFKHRRDLLLERINGIDGITCDTPHGAFYIYPECTELMGRKTPQGKILQSDEDFAHYLLEQANVAVVHGEAFGLSPYFRISYAIAENALQEACVRIKKAVENLS